MFENENENTDDKSLNDEAGGAGGDDKGDKNQEKKEFVSKEDHERAIKDLHKYKAKAKELEKKEADATTKRMKDEQKWQELAEAREKEAKEAKDEADRIRTSYLGDRKYSVLHAECAKLGIRPEALSDLEGLDLEDLQVETTSTGKINVLGASEFARRLKTTKPHWFTDQKSTKINPGGSRIIDSGEAVTPAMIYEAEKKGKKSGDLSEYNELNKKYFQQRAGASRR